MRIAIIAPPWVPVPPPGYGGIEAVADYLARGLDGLGHEVLLAAGPGSTCPVTRIDTIASGENGAIGDVQAEREHVTQAYEAIARSGVDIVHDNTLAGPALARDPSDPPVVATIHGEFDPATMQWLNRWQPDVSVVAISHHQASTAGSYCVDRVIHHGIDVKHFPMGLGEGGYLAWLGRMSPVKGAHEAIDIARAAGMPLRIAAKMREPAEREYFHEFVKPRLGEDVEYIGELTAREKFAFLRSATALLNPIRWPEPFGMVMIEAMSVGTPVIVTPCGAAPEVVDDGITGFVRDDHNSLVEAVHAVGRLDRRAIRHRTLSRFSMERLARDHVALYNDVIARRAAAPAPIEEIA